MTQHLINLALALSAGELVHNILEAQQARLKVNWLKLTLAGKKYKATPLNINTRVKAYTATLIGFIIITAVFYGVFTLLNLSLDTALKTIAVLLTLAYLVSAVLMDKYHVEIGRITNPLRKKL